VWRARALRVRVRAVSVLPILKARLRFVSRWMREGMVPMLRGRLPLKVSGVRRPKWVA
jgi:hypothetical protein